MAGKSKHRGGGLEEHHIDRANITDFRFDETCSENENKNATDSDDNTNNSNENNNLNIIIVILIVAIKEDNI